jgi:hypothetical protein
MPSLDVPKITCGLSLTSPYHTLPRTQLNETYLAGPFYFLFPLPFCIIYFWNYCEAKFKKPSMNLSFGFAKELDARNAERRAAGRPVPHDGFRKDLYRQPALTEQEVYPEPYRRDTSYDHLRQPPSEEDLEAAAGAGGGGEEKEVPELVAALRRAARRQPSRTYRAGTMSINVHEELDQGENCQRVLKVPSPQPLGLYCEQILPPDPLCPSPCPRPTSKRWCCRWPTRPRCPRPSAASRPRAVP